MDTVIEFYNSLGLDFPAHLTIGAVILIGLVVCFLICHFIFGKIVLLKRSVSSSIAIIFTYLAVIGLSYAGAQFASFVAPMPFVTVNGSHLELFSFSGANYTTICSQVLSMVILSFLVNTIDRWMFKSSNLFVWLIFRLLTVSISLILHLIVSVLLQTYLPEGFMTYAPVVLVGILIVLLLTGVLKLVVGAFLTTINPIIAALYTFFFSTLIGNMLTKAVLTTGLMAGLILLLSRFGIYSIDVSGTALLTYIPFFAILAIFWYLIRER